jgi:hypothetical protein
MSRWDIEPPGVAAVLTKVETHATDLGTAATSLSTDMQICGGAIGQSIVAKALSDFATARGPELQDAGTRITTAVKGTVDAVTDYINGNLTMAANAQTVASQVTPPTTTGPGPHPR